MVHQPGGGAGGGAGGGGSSSSSVQSQKQRVVRWSSPHVASSSDDSFSTNSLSTPRHGSQDQGKPPLPLRRTRRHYLATLAAAEAAETGSSAPSSAPSSSSSAPSSSAPSPHPQMDRSTEESVSSALSDGCGSSSLLSSSAMSATQQQAPAAKTKTTKAKTKTTSPLEVVREGGGEQWRKHGKLFRARLLMKDEESGGNTFILSSNCSIERYYDVAGKVLDQFLKASTDESSDLTESYLVGNRLVKFLSSVMPTHQNYWSDQPHLANLRNKSQTQLVELLQYLEQLALIIDEEELNKYILQDLDSQDGMLSSPDSSPNRTGEVKHGQHADAFPSMASPIQNRSSHSLDITDADFDSSRDATSPIPLPRNSPLGEPPRDKTVPARRSTADRQAAAAAAIPLTSTPVKGESNTAWFAATSTTTQASPRTSQFLESSPRSHVNLLLQSREDQSAEWDERFSEYGAATTTTKLRHKKKPPQEESDQSLMNDSGLDGVKFIGDVSHDDLGFPDCGGIGSDWSPGFHRKDPFHRVKTMTTTAPTKESSRQSILRHQPDMLSTMEAYSASVKIKSCKTRNSIYATATPRRDASTTTVREAVLGNSSHDSQSPSHNHPQQSALDSTPSSDASSHRTPDAAPTLERESSPQSVLELAPWQSLSSDVVVVGGPELRLMHHRYSDDCSSLGTHEDVDLSLRSKRKPPLHHFKGCIKCLLE